MKIDVEYAELHTPLFLAGTNLGSKLNVKDHKRRGMTLDFDYDKRRLLVGWNGKTACVPEANVASFVEADDVPVEMDSAAVAKTPIKAQVSSPQDHVFAGAGHGKK